MRRYSEMSDYELGYEAGKRMALRELNEDADQDFAAAKSMAKDEHLIIVVQGSKFGFFVDRGQGGGLNNLPPAVIEKIFDVKPTGSMVKIQSQSLDSIKDKFKKNGFEFKKISSITI